MVSQSRSTSSSSDWVQFPSGHLDVALAASGGLAASGVEENQAVKGFLLPSSQEFPPALELRSCGNGAVCTGGQSAQAAETRLAKRSTYLASLACLRPLISDSPWMTHS
ncbi:unnamed protein product [Effrenium voratum]|uniref:Uncharacterized protein n=1 Tax=Effrenium voratum TaxID=2562239 RepID=A0AA36I251_9DINO|nr:unnamed protein product [Effrenium voratum]CAJ1437575.1 unnamed protein product [Effrenium voratum]